MNIARKIKELAKENVVDYKQEGKNKVYFLKNTIEARNYMLITEIYKLNRLLEKYPDLRGIIEKIQQDGRIKLAILFGSYAKGIAKKESDIDVYIETENRKIKNELSVIDTRMSIKIGKFDTSSLLIKEIIKNHVILKGVEGHHEKTKIFY
jgi:predicted nucleotidyltransferase